MNTSLPPPCQGWQPGHHSSYSGSLCCQLQSPWDPWRPGGEAGGRFSQGLVNFWLDYKQRCSFNQIPSVLGKKKKKSWFQIHFRIYNLWCLPVEFFAHLKLPSFNHLPLSTQEPLVDWPARLPCKAKATWEQLAFIAFLINSFYFQLSSDSLHTHTLWRLISPWPWHMPLFFLFHCLKCMWKH